MRLIDADKLIYSNIKTNGYGYVEVIETVVLEQDIANAKTVKAIPVNCIKQTREEIENMDIDDYIDVLEENGCTSEEFRVSKKFVTAILDKLIAESEEK